MARSRPTSQTLNCCSARSNLSRPPSSLASGSAGIVALAAWPADARGYGPGRQTSFLHKKSTGILVYRGGRRVWNAEWGQAKVGFVH